MTGAIIVFCITIVVPLILTVLAFILCRKPVNHSISTTTTTQEQPVLPENKYNYQEKPKIQDSYFIEKVLTYEALDHIWNS